MLRLLPLLAFALLPAAVAAPVPPGGRAEFGTNGLVTRADLENVKFDTRPAKDEDVRNRPDESDEPKEGKAGEGDAPQPKNRFDLAVHMPWARFREGEPIPAYFVLRNNRDSTLGLESRIDLSGPTATARGGGTSFDIRDRATGKSVVILRSASTNCGGGSLVDVPAKGFYCERGELNRLAGATLPPGEYEIDWRCGRLASAPVHFTVTRADAKPAALARRPHVHFYHLSPRFGDELPDGVGEPLVARECRLDHAYTASMSAALAVGQNGVYVPDVHTIPAADRFVEARVEWRHHREGDRVSVTLRAVPPHTRVRFEEVPQLFLQVESTGEKSRGRRGESLGDAKRSAREDGLLVTPLTLELRLPKDWRERVGVDGVARVAVLVAARRIEFPAGNGVRLQQAIEKRLDRKAGDRPPVWSGVVRTGFTELRFPPASEKLELR